VPHKKRVLEHVDVVDARAQTVGAANTLASDAGVVKAYNTDAAALAEELGLLAPEARASWQTGRALVLGAGGAARAAVVALALDLGFAKVAVRARAFADRGARGAFERETRALLASAGARTELTAEPWAAAAELEESTLVVVQATSAGMAGADPGEPVAVAVAWNALPAPAVALDAVYAPLETPFLRAAAARGLRSANGLGMLARQGALAFQLWLGVSSAYEPMLAALR